MIVTPLRTSTGALVERYVPENAADRRWLEEQIRAGRIDGGDLPASGRTETPGMPVDPTVSRPPRTLTEHRDRPRVAPKMTSNLNRRGMGVYWAKTVKRVHVPAAERFEAALRTVLNALGRAAAEHVRSGKPGPFPLEPWKARFREALGPLYGEIVDRAARDLVATSRAKSVTKARRRGKLDLEDLDEGALIETLEARPDVFLETIWERLNANLEEMVAAERNADERAQTIEERFRSMLEDGEGGPSSVRTIAVTESSAAVSGGRMIVLVESGLEQHVWVDSRDSRVRSSHTIYGESGPRPLGFNWAKLSGNGSVLLRFPLDPECEDASEVANCRCFAAPADEEFEGTQEELNELLGDIGEDEDEE